MDIANTTTANFQSDVLDSSLPVLVDFTAEWCGPCRMLDPVIHQLAQEWSGKVKVLKLDIDENADVTMRYQVMGVPTLILFIGGQPVERLTGYQAKNRLIAKFTPHFA